MKKIISIALALVLIFGIQLGFGNYAEALPTYLDGSYKANVQMMNAGDISQPSMANAAIEPEGTMDIINGEWFLTVTFRTMNIGPIEGNASNIRYYTDYPNQNSIQPATVLTTRENGLPADVKIPVPANSQGIYLKVYVDAMNSNPDLYCKYTMVPKYEVEATAMGHGSISPSGSVMVTEGENQMFSITPDVGYRIKDVLVDDASVGPVNSYEMTNVTENHTIKAEFEKDGPMEYTIEARAGQHGSISPTTPTGMVMVAEGASQSFTITPDAGYVIKDVLVDEISVGTESTYTFENVTENHTIMAEFEAEAPVEYTIEARAEEHGSISPEGTVTVVKGEDQSFTITPDQGYRIKEVLVDDLSVGTQSEYTFENIMEEHTIVAQFEELTPLILYEFISGEDQSMIEDVSSIESLVINADYSDFESLWVDGQELIRDTDYTAKSGSTIITFSKDYLKSLGAGKHEVKALFKNNGMATTTLTALSKDNLADGNYVVDTTILKENVDEPSMADVMFVKEADVKITGDQAQIKFYVAHPIPAFPNHGKDGTLKNMFITYNGQKYTGTSDITTKPMKPMKQTSPAYGLVEGKAVPTQIITFNLPKSALKEHILPAGAYVNVMMDTDVNFRIQLDNLRMGASPTGDAEHVDTAAVNNNTNSTTPTMTGMNKMMMPATGQESPLWAVILLVLAALTALTTLFVRKRQHR